MQLEPDRECGKIKGKREKDYILFVSDHFFAVIYCSTHFSILNNVPTVPTDLFESRLFKHVQ